MPIRKRPELPTDDQPEGLVSALATLAANPDTPLARFSHFPYDLLARYINHKVEFTVTRGRDLETPWIVRKLS